jgi:hypothetical protein
MAAETTFEGLVVTIPAATPAEAYKLLCNALNEIAAEWESDSYSFEGSAPRPTVDLWETEEESDDAP